MVVKEAHQKFYDSLPTLLEHFEATKAFDRITVVTRDGDVLYVGDYSENQPVRAAQAGPMIKAIRAQGMSILEKRRYCDTFDNVIDMHKQFSCAEDAVAFKRLQQKRAMYRPAAS